MDGVVSGIAGNTFNALLDTSDPPIWLCTVYWSITTGNLLTVAVDVFVNPYHGGRRGPTFINMCNYIYFEGEHFCWYVAAWSNKFSTSEC